MDKEWSEKNKEIQRLLGKKSTYKDGIQKLIDFRGELFGQITQITESFPPYAFYQTPYAGADGYHSKTLSYSIWHIFRIEDIVAHELVTESEQVLFSGGFQKSTGSPIITTGNELDGDELVSFSKSLDIKELHRYAQAVMQSTNEILSHLEYPDLKRIFYDDSKQRLISTECVSTSDKASWLIDFWCRKDVCGLIKMPFCRHWIMHIEAMCRIKNKLCTQARKGVDPIAYCGLSCNHCFLSQWCGSCRTDYNTCSFAVGRPDGKCPNAVCCRERGIDGCYECPKLENCRKGLYTPENDGAAAAKAQAMYIARHGKKQFLKMQNKLHVLYSFQKTQEILGQDMYEGLNFLEKTDLK